MTIVSNRKVYEHACDLLTRYKEDESINLKEECRRLENTNNKDRKKIVSLVINYLAHKDEVKNFKKESRIKCKKRDLDDHLVRLMLTEMLYSPCFKENSFKDWKEMNYLVNFNEQINEKKKTITLRQLPIKQAKKRKNKDVDQTNGDQSNDQTNSQSNGQSNGQVKNVNTNDNHKNNKQSYKKLKKLNQDHLELFKDVKEIPVKYLRVNRIKTNVNELIYELVNDLEFIQVGRKFDCFNDFLKKLFNLKENEFMLDYHFPDDLIVVHNSLKKEFQNYRIYQNGNVIFQDKASLIPIKCANLKKGMRIADVCCAPGMKTFGISSNLENDCQIISIDIDEGRIEMMKGLMDKLGVNCTQIKQLDFTETTIEDFKFNDDNQEIDVLFLDPSCSGSGMIDKRTNENEQQPETGENQEDRKRLMKLASFQTRLLCHAMSLRPKLIIYSTCSFSIWENEFVVCKTEEQADNAWEYELVQAFPEWPKRGDKKFTCSHKVLRADPSRGTRGFFTAVFKLKDSNV